MVVNEMEPSAASPYEGSTGYADRAYAGGAGQAWPVSGDHTAALALPEYPDARAAEPKQGARQLVAGGWLQRRPLPAEAVVTVQCEDCPWGLDVQGWDERAAIAQKLAQRHADTRRHTVTAKQVR